MQRLDGLDASLPECAIILEAAKAAKDKGLTLEALADSLIVQEVPQSLVEVWYAQCEEEFTRSGLGKKRAKLEWAQFTQMDAGRAVQNYAAYSK